MSASTEELLLYTIETLEYIGAQEGKDIEDRTLELLDMLWAWRIKYLKDKARKPSVKLH